MKPLSNHEDDNMIGVEPAIKSEGEVLVFVVLPPVLGPDLDLESEVYDEADDEDEVDDDDDDDGFEPEVGLEDNDERILRLLSELSEVVDRESNWLQVRALLTAFLVVAPRLLRLLRLLK